MRGALGEAGDEAPVVDAQLLGEQVDLVEHDDVGHVLEPAVVPQPLEDLQRVPELASATCLLKTGSETGFHLRIKTGYLTGEITSLNCAAFIPVTFLFLPLFLNLRAFDDILKKERIQL